MKLLSLDGWLQSTEVEDFLPSVFTVIINICPPGIGKPLALFFSANTKTIGQQFKNVAPSANL